MKAEEWVQVIHAISSEADVIGIKITPSMGVAVECWLTDREIDMLCDDLRRLQAEKKSRDVEPE